MSERYDDELIQALRDLTTELRSYRLERRRLSRASRTSKWTRESVVARLQQWYSEAGETPAQAHWALSAEGRPTSKTVQAIFGSWTAAIEATGLPKRPSGPPRRHSRESIIEALRLWVARHGEIPRQSDWAFQTDDFPHDGAVGKVFGSWNAAIEAAGFTPRTAGGQPDPNKSQRRYHEAANRQMVTADGHDSHQVRSGGKPAVETIRGG